ncbi:hypothetical protein [Leptospira wolffii]|uniref:hypothetical protein n=1 Tax=Leptospira wolffii TaxID=409998 RepID=UPI000308ABF5|nr:hypothetical protein [Leptospira wolffii]EPG67709.1 hypothetical protein LEP1GSC061_0967 [Leptospira wolffii serovar Khorat str. Khorat-H2]
MGKDFGPHGVANFSLNQFTTLGSGRLKIKGSVGSFLDHTLGKSGLAGWAGDRLSPNGWLKPIIKNEVKDGIRENAKKNMIDSLKEIYLNAYFYNNGNLTEEDKERMQNEFSNFLFLHFLAPSAANYVAGIISNDIVKVFVGSSHGGSIYVGYKFYLYYIGLQKLRNSL